MSNKNSNSPYDQIPHIVINHQETNSDHWAIMIVLYKRLKDEIQCVYTNKTISKNTRIPLRTVERRIYELIEMGFIKSIGRGYNRRLSLGLLFDNSATMAVENVKYSNNTAKNTLLNRHGGGDNKKNNTNINITATMAVGTFVSPSAKKNISFSSLSHEETKELEFCVKRNLPLNSDFKYLQPLLNEVLKK